MPSKLKFGNRPLPAQIKIAYFITSLEVGGSERQLVALNSGLPPSEFEKHIICLSGYGALEAQARSTGAQLYDLRYPRIKTAGTIQIKNIPSVATTTLRLLKLLRDLKPDILHTMIPVCNVLGATAGRLAGVPCIVCTKLALGVYRDKSRVLARLENLTDRLFDLVHCKSNGILEDVATREPIPREKMRVVYNGLRVEQYQRNFDRSATRSQFDIPPDAPVIGMVANLIPYKGHKDVIQAAPEILARAPHARFLFVGRDNGIQEELRAHANSLGIQNAIIFAGERRDVPELMAAMDLLVSASYEEGFSNVLLEAMASGLPVVATQVGGNPEAVADGQTGFIVPPHAPEQLARAILDLLENPELARDFGQRAKKRVEELFSFDSMIRGMRDFYQEVLQQKGIR